MLSVKPQQTLRISDRPAYLPISPQGKPHDGLQNTLKMTGILVLLIAAHLVFPRLAKFNLDVSLFTTINIFAQDALADSKHQPAEQQELPNFGAPNSDRGSGTR